MAKLLSELAKGAWSDLVNYTIGDIVNNDGSSYICIANHLNQEPPNTTYWVLLASKGDIDTALIEVEHHTDGTHADVNLGESADFLVQHNADGTHKSGLVTTLKAAGSDITTGTNDTKIVTPKAMKDAGFVLDTDTGLAANSDAKVPSQKAIKTYVDNAVIPAALKKCRVYKDANQSVPNSTDTVLAFNQETFDNDTMHDNVTNNSRIIATTAGLYLLVAQVAFASNSTGSREVHFRQNGSDKLGYSRIRANTGDRTTMQVETLAVAAAADYFEVVVNHSSGGALDIEGAASDAYYATHFEAVRLGPAS